MEQKTHILVCACARTDLVPAGRVDEILGLLKENGISHRAVSDFCGLAAQMPEKIKELKRVDKLTVIACYPRSVRWILYAAGIDREGKKTRVYNLRDYTAEEILSDIKAEGSSASSEVEDWAGAWQPWYPVIDYDRCTHCGQCADFCLFGVYEKNDDGKVRVIEPASCKDGCPACARICPNVAIIFPKYAGAPINGDEISNEEEVREMVKVNMEEVLGDNIYAALAERRRKARKRKLLKKQNGGGK